MTKIVTLGEIMLRLSTNQGTRLQQSEAFAASYGGSEANVAISLANYGHNVVFASRVPKNALGEAVEKQLQRYGVQTNFLLKGGARLGTYFLESGSGERATKVIYDRAGSSFATMNELLWQLDDLFEQATIFHISGITPALSPNWQVFTLTLMQAAKAHGCLISFDINYRGNLWQASEARKVIQTLMPYVDYCSASQLDAIHFLTCSEEKGKSLLAYYQEIGTNYPNIQVIYSTKRQIHSASYNTLVGTFWNRTTYVESTAHEITPIVDRVGGGDAFSAGILHGIVKKWSPQQIIDFATAAAALKHTISGDFNQFSEKEVQDFLQTKSGKIIR